MINHATQSKLDAACRWFLDDIEREGVSSSSRAICASPRAVFLSVCLPRYHQHRRSRKATQLALQISRAFRKAPRGCQTLHTLSCIATPRRTQRRALRGPATRTCALDGARPVANRNAKALVGRHPRRPSSVSGGRDSALDRHSSAWQLSGSTSLATRDALSPGSIHPQPRDKRDTDAAGVARRCRRRAPVERGEHRVRRDGGNDAHDPLLQLHGGRRVAPTDVPSVRRSGVCVYRSRAVPTRPLLSLFRPLMGTCVCSDM